MLPRVRRAAILATSSACTTNSAATAAATRTITLLHASTHAEREELERRERSDGDDLSLRSDAQRSVANIDPAAPLEIRQPPREDAVERAVAFIGSNKPLAMAERSVVEHVVHQAARKT